MKILTAIFVMLLATMAGAEDWKIVEARYVARGAGACLVCGKDCSRGSAVDISSRRAGENTRGCVHLHCTGIDGWNPWRGPARADGEPLREETAPQETIARRGPHGPAEIEAAHYLLRPTLRG